MSSAVTGTTRHHELARQLNAESIGARIWAGIHIRTADETGTQWVHRVGAWAVNHYFTPTEDY